MYTAPFSCPDAVHRPSRDFKVERSSSKGHGVTYKVYRSAKAAFRLESADFFSVPESLPYVDAPIKSGTSKVGAIFGQRYCPYFPRLVAVCVFVSRSSTQIVADVKLRTHNHSLLGPKSLIATPDPCIASEASACQYIAISTCSKVVTSQVMGIIKRLREREVGLIGGVYFDMRRP